MDVSSQQWVTSQIGAREHYAVPRALRMHGVLQRLYTDAWCPRGQSLLRRLPDPVRSFANRYHPDVPNARVTSFPARALWNRLDWHWRAPTTRGDAYYEHHMRVGRDFARAVGQDLLERYSGFENHVFFGYNTASLETLDRLDSTACTTIVDQIDPGRVEKEIVIREAERWPDWVDSVPMIHDGFERRLQAEWETADWVVVNSAWSKEALVEQDVDPEKIQVVPLAYEPPSEVGSVGSTSLPLRVLWLGTVNLRKGIPYLVQAARALEDAPIQFQIVGPIEITEDAVAGAPSNMEFVGRIPRGETGGWYRNADVFVLPTLSDGFAITQLEAMAHGLPVIATPRCGDVVTDGEDGMLVPPRDETALTEAFTRLIEKPGRLAPMSRRALETAETFTLDRIAEQLMGLASEET